MIHAPVCGSDGNTYVNQCSLQAKACAEKAEIHAMHEGQCKDAESKDGGSDNCNQICNDKSIAPICGSDNKTYVNECILKVKNCQTGNKVEKVTNEACALTSLVYDASDNEEEEDENPDPASNCSKVCEERNEPVCVNGHRSYINRCQMEVITCQDKIEVNTIDLGFCQTDDCSPQGCSQDENPVCGSNDITYRNECLLKKVACEEKVQLYKKSDGECQTVEKIMNTDEEDDKSCLPLCPKHYMPVCGSDGKTYNNACFLKSANCKDKSIVLNHQGVCDPEKFQQAGNHHFF